MNSIYLKLDDVFKILSLGLNQPADDLKSIYLSKKKKHKIEIVNADIDSLGDYRYLLKEYQVKYDISGKHPREIDYIIEKQNRPVYK